MKLLILHHESAGDGAMTREHLCGPFAEAGFDIIYRRRKTDKVKKADLAEADVMLVAGGDGTVGKVVLAYRDRISRFSIVPLGTANNIATGLEITGTPAQIAVGLHDARSRRYDIGRITGPFEETAFLEGVGVGAIAAAMSAADRQDGSGQDQKQFSRSMLPRTIAAAAPQDWQVRIDGAPMADDLILLEVLNGPLIGPNLRLAPDADPGDGCFDVAYLRQVDRAQAMAAAEAGRDLPLRHARGQVLDMLWQAAPLRIDDRFHAAPPTGTPLRIEIGQRIGQVELLVPAYIQEDQP